MNKKSTRESLSTLVFALVFCARILGASIEDQIVEASQVNNLKAAKAAAVNGFDAKSPKSESALATALGNDEDALPFVTFLLDSGVDPQFPVDGSPVWFRVISRQNGPALKLLLTRNAISVSGTNKPDPVYAAATLGWMTGLKLLVEHGAKPDLVTDSGETALLTVSQVPLWGSWRESEYADAAAFLIRHGAEPNRKNHSGLTAADLAFSSASMEVLREVDTLHIYTSRFDEIRQKNLDRRLWSDVNRHMTSRIRWAGNPPQPPINLKNEIAELIHQGAHPYVTFVTEGARSPAIAQACGFSQVPAAPDPELARIILLSKDKPPIGGISPLVYAARSPELLAAFLEHGFTVDEMFPENALSAIRTDRLPLSNSKIGVLHALATIGTPEAIQALIRSGASVNALTEDGRTALHCALQVGNVQNAIALLDNRAEPTIKNRDGQDAVDLAARLTAVRLLRRIDTKKRYSSLLKQFPADPKSALLGAWNPNPKPNTFPQPKLELRGDGSGSLGHHEIGWRRQEDVLILSMAVLVPTYSGPQIQKKQRVFEIFGNGSTASLIPQHPEEGVGSLYRDLSHILETKVIIGDEEGRLAQARISDRVYYAVEGSSLTSLPNSLFEITRLEELDILGTALEMVPAEIGNFPCLTRLRIDGNKIQEIDGRAFRAPALENISINRNPLTSLPPEIAKNHTAQSVYLAENSLHSLPEGWEESTSLSWINIDDNELHELPRSLSRSPKLKGVSARKNLLTTIPAEFAGTHIEELNLAQNGIATLPETLEKMPDLRVLDVSGNPLSGDIQEVSKCINLTSVHLGSLDLRSFPDLSRLPLHDLDLSNNRIASWPSGPEALPSNLEELDLRGNRLTEVPPWIEDLTLRRISLYGNPIPEARQREVEEKIRKNWQQKQKTLRAKAGR